eukprot:Rmarinus@m.20108
MKCFLCGKSLEKPLRCSQCKSVYYCSTVCQRSNWREHKRRCKPEKAFVEVPTRSYLKDAPDLGKVPHLFRNFEYVHSIDGVDENLLVVFPGMGDTASNFVGMIKKMALPQTAALVLPQPMALPIEGVSDGGQWFEYFDETMLPITPDKTTLRRVASLLKTRRLLWNLTEYLVTLGWTYDAIFLLGYAQGGTVATDLALFLGSRGKRVGGLVVLSGCALEEFSEGWQGDGLVAPPNSIPQPVPVLITIGDRESHVDVYDARNSLDYIKRSQALIMGTSRDTELLIRNSMDGEHTEACVLEVIKGKSKGVISNEAEARIVMKFFGSYMRRRNLALENNPDIVEVVKT